MYYARPGNADKWRALLLILFIAIISITITWAPVQTPDWNRFEGQAISLLNGTGFRTGDVLETTLPPGYPVFIATLYSLGGDEELVPYIQAALITIAAILLYLSLRPINRTWALTAGATLAGYPYIARSASYYLSEALGVFLCGAVVFLLSRVLTKTATLAEFFLLGFALMALPLTSPATIFVAFFLGCYLVATSWRDRAAVLSFVAGVVVLLVPWQLHCTHAEKKFCETLYSTKGFDKGTSYFSWYQTWATSEGDLKFYFHPKEYFHLIPDEVFASAAERYALASALDSNSSNFEEAFSAAARRRIESDPLRYHVLLPAVRSLNLWVHMNQLGHVQAEYVWRLGVNVFLEDLRQWGVEKAILRVGKAVLSTGVYLFSLIFPVLLLWLTFFALATRNYLAFGFVAGVWIYTFVSGSSALGESRRDMVFFPLLLFLFVWVSFHNSKKRLESQGCAGIGAAGIADASKNK